MANMLFLQLEGIEHRRTKVSRPQSNGIVERLHRTLLDEHFRVQGRKIWFETVDEMQVALDTYFAHDNEPRLHRGRGMKGRTPLKAFKEDIPKPEPKGGQHTTPKATTATAA
jgi:transposase InsO family protein